MATTASCLQVFSFAKQYKFTSIFPTKTINISHPVIIIMYLFHLIVTIDL